MEERIKAKNEQNAAREQYRLTKKQRAATQKKCGSYTHNIGLSVRYMKDLGDSDAAVVATIVKPS